MNTIICYDITSTKRRNKVATLLEAKGVRANYSVFELNISKNDLEALKQQFLKLISKKQDKILIYRICENCLAKSEVLGEGKIFAPLDTYV